MLGAARLTSEQRSSGPKGQQTFNNAGGSFVVPTGVMSISAVAIGRGGTAIISVDDPDTYYQGGKGGNLRYENSISVTPGETLTVSINNAASGLSRGGTALVRAFSFAPSGVQAGIGFDGGFGGFTINDGGGSASGGGAGGYTSNGGGGQSTGTSRGGGGSSLLGGGAGAPGGGSLDTLGQDYGGGSAGNNGAANKGGVRIIWGSGRAYPNTNTGDV